MLVGRRGRDGEREREREVNGGWGGDEEEGYRLEFCKLGGREGEGRGGECINHVFTIM